MRSDKYDKKYHANLNSRARKVSEILADAQRKAIAIAIGTGYDGNGSFFFEDYGIANDQIDDLLHNTADLLTANMKNGNKASWELSLEKMSAIVAWVGGYADLQKSKVEKWTDPLTDKLKEFNNRKVKTVSLASGKRREMTLSSRVWNLSGQFKQEIELAVEAAMSEGISADELSRKVRRYLNDPDKLFRRVIDKSGVLRLSKAAAAYHPGVGVYRSSYMNAKRMTVTEINRAYRTADYIRWKDTPFIKGIEIKITLSRHERDICDDLAGKYPKEFKFTGWHPWCRCYVVPILPSVEEFKKWDGKSGFGEVKYDGVEKLQKWTKENAGRIEKVKTMPDFLKDNEKFWKKNYETALKADKERRTANHKEYERLSKDKDYKDVAYDEKSGGVKATHVGHNLDKNKGWYEEKVRDVGYLNGHSVILEKEDHTKRGMKNTEGIWDGQKFEIAGAETATENNIRNALKHCASKPGSEIAVIFFPNDNFSAETFADGYSKYAGLKGTTQYKKFRIVYCISRERILLTKKPDD